MDIKNWLIDKILDETDLERDTIDCDAAFETFNLDSLATISIAFDIENEFKLEELNPTIFTEYNSINLLAEWSVSALSFLLRWARLMPTSPANASTPN